MRLSLNVKYILSVLALGVCCFLCISTCSSHLMMQNAVTARASALYQEGLYMSDQYVGNYFEEPESRKALSSVQ